MGRRQAGPAVVAREDGADLVLAGPRPRVAGQQAPDEPHVAEVGGGQLVVAALALERQHLDGPAADARDRAQPPPGAVVVGAAQVDAPGRDVARRVAQRQGTAVAEAAGLELGRGERGDRRRARDVAQPGACAARAVAPDDAPLDGRGAVELDELLADRPGQRLEGLGPAPDAQPRAGAHRAADERVAGEAGVELAQVVVDAEGEAQAPQRLVGRRARRRPGAEDHPVGGGLGGARDDALAADVEHALEDGPAAAQHAVAPAAGQAEGPGRADLGADLDHRDAALYAPAPTARRDLKAPGRRGSAGRRRGGRRRRRARRDARSRG